MNDVVLCVDDEENVLHALKRELNRVADKVLIANSGAEGLEILRSENVAVVVSDMRMPKMDGAEFLKHVHDGWPDTFRILLTGYADLDTVTAGVNDGGIHRFVVKPWDTQEFRQIIKMGFDRINLVRENRALTEQLEIQNVELQDLNEDLERRVAERTAQLEVAYADLVHSEKLSAVGKLAAGVVHEVLNPLTVAMGRIEMMKMDKDLKEGQARNLEIGLSQIEKAVKILDNLRDFSKQRPPERTWQNLNVLVSDSLELLSHEFIKKSITASKSLGASKEVLIDQDQLSQVFLNLFGNAVDAMNEGGQLKVITDLKIHEGVEGVELAIADTGEGIPEENMRRIFDPFFTSKENGTGLGLSICQGIIENHGGKISVQSTLGKGTVFLIWLPIGA